MVSYDLTVPDVAGTYGGEPLDTTAHSKYRSIVGALLYLSNTTRIDISYIVNVLARSVDCPTTIHMKVAINVIKYLKGTAGHGLVFKANAGNGTAPKVVAYGDADWAGDKTTRKSTTGTVITLNGNIVYWSTKKQQSVSRSTTEAEYVALANTTADCLWVRNWLTEVLVTPISQAIPPIIVYCDNQSTVHLVYKDDNHNSAKHIDIALHFIKDYAAKGTVIPTWISTADNISDILTKSLSTSRFQSLRDKVVSIIT